MYAFADGSNNDQTGLVMEMPQFSNGFLKTTHGRPSFYEAAIRRVIAEQTVCIKNGRLVKQPIY